MPETIYENAEETMNARNILCDAGYEEAVLFECPDYDSAIIGVSEDGRAVYDYEKMVQQLQEDEVISREEAIDFIEYNTIRGMDYIKNPPIIIHRLEDLQ